MEVYRNRRSLIPRWIIAFILLLLFGGTVFLVFTGYSVVIDEPVSDFIYDLRATWLTAFFKVVSFLADPTAIIVMCAALLIFPKTTLRIGIPLALATGIGSAVHTGLKLLIERERPDDVLNLVDFSSYSFPSGHANAGLIFYLFLSFLVGRVLKQKGSDDIAGLITIVFSIIVFLIGISRIYLGVHYPVDVIGGWCLGGFLLILFISLYDAFYPLKYHLGDQRNDWSAEGISPWNRPDKTESSK